MKKQLKNAIEKKVFTLLLAAVVLCAGSSNSYALPDRAVKAIKNAEISYQGLKDKMLVFKVDYKNEAAENFQLVIMNEHNETIYAKKFDAKPLTTDVYLSEFPENCKLTIAIRSGKKEYSQSFSINTDVKTVEDFIVKSM